MLDKRNLEQILSDQQEELEIRRGETLCHRLEEALIDLSSTQAQVVIGVRRSGKSTLCFQALEKAGVKYAYVDFDDERLAKIQAEDLNDILEVLYKIYGDFNYLFLDEIQNIEGWHLFVNRMLRKRMHVIVTGSNAKLLSSDLATHLSGRSKEIPLYPFSFYEYCMMKKVDTEGMSTKKQAFRRAAFDDYLKLGGFPELHIIGEHQTYVKNLVSNILQRDIEQRFKITYQATFEQLAHHLLNVARSSYLLRNYQPHWGKIGTYHQELYRIFEAGLSADGASEVFCQEQDEDNSREGVSNRCFFDGSAR